MEELVAAPETKTQAKAFEPDKVASYVPEHPATSPRVLVIGSGPVGVRFVHQYLKRHPNASLTLMGDEPFQPYNRVQLSTLLAGEVAMEDIILPLPSPSLYPKFKHHVARALEIDIERKVVTDSLGLQTSYDSLVLATGSRAHVPHIPGVEQKGVFTFRNLKDTEFLYSRLARCRHLVVVGGGLLGIEAARALRRANTRVTLVQQSTRLMNRQLDDKASALLRAKVEQAGIEVITESGVREILGETSRVTGVRLRNGQRLECDTVLLCAGIRPNVDLARAAKLKVATGVLVDDELRTSAEDVFAIGECCEHRGQTYGLVNPGLEQAAVAAETVARHDARYIGSLEVSRLKVLGETVCSMGDVTDPVFHSRQYQLTWQSRDKQTYRKVVITKGKVTGALCFGDWEEVPRVQEAYQTERRVHAWHMLRFLLTGYLWTQDSDVALWPGTAVICQCNSVTQGELVSAIGRGCNSVTALREETRASSTCGSCKPFLQSLLGNQAEPEKEKAWLPLFLASVFAAVVAAVVFSVPGLTVGESVQSPAPFEKVWNDKFYKQVTGFTLLGLTAVGLLMSLRKRIKLGVIARLGDYSWWRLLHVVLGAGCAGLLFFHTGLHLGENLNFWLMMNFLIVLVLGAATGAVVALSHKLVPPQARKLRSFWNWAHTLVVWPLPVLLIMHILSVYYF